MCGSLGDVSFAGSQLQLTAGTTATCPAWDVGKVLGSGTALPEGCQRLSDQTTGRNRQKHYGNKAAFVLVPREKYPKAVIQEIYDKMSVRI